jgi:hypothetical protein
MDSPRKCLKTTTFVSKNHCTSLTDPHRFQQLAKSPPYLYVTHLHNHTIVYNVLSQRSPATLESLPLSAGKLSPVLQHSRKIPRIVITHCRVTMRWSQTGVQNYPGPEKLVESYDKGKGSVDVPSRASSSWGSELCAWKPVHTHIRCER